MVLNDLIILLSLKATQSRSECMHDKVPVQSACYPILRQYMAQTKGHWWLSAGTSVVCSNIIGNTDGGKEAEKGLIFIVLRIVSNCLKLMQKCPHMY